MLGALVDALVEAVAWALSLLFGERPDRPRWLRALVTLVYIAVFSACVLATIVVLG